MTKYDLFEEIYVIYMMDGWDGDINEQMDKARGQTRKILDELKEHGTTHVYLSTDKILTIRIKPMDQRKTVDDLYDLKIEDKVWEEDNNSYRYIRCPGRGAPYVGFVRSPHDIPPLKEKSELKLNKCLLLI